MMHRKLIYLIFFMVCIIYFVTGCSNTENTQQMLSFSSIQMVDERDGWALCNSKILRTIDGGKNWIEATPDIGKAKKTVLGKFFLTSDIGWVALGEDYQHLTSNSSVTICTTYNGGKNWEKADIPGQYLGAKLDFINKEIGWVELDYSGGLAQQPWDIYHTKDGGKSWVEVASTGTVTNEPDSIPLSPLKEGFCFLNDSRGWVTGQPRANGYAMLYITNDGGRTWNYQDLPIPEEYQHSLITIKAPIFFNDKDGVLPVTFDVDQPQPGIFNVFYHTSDGGMNWLVSSPLFTSTPIVYDFIDSKTGWVVDGTSSTLYTTIDGGKKWTNYNTDLKDISQIDFVNSKVGWAITNGALYKTVDGGKSFNKLRVSVNY